MFENKKVVYLNSWCQHEAMPCHPIRFPYGARTTGDPRKGGSPKDWLRTAKCCTCILGLTMRSCIATRHVFHAARAQQVSTGDPRRRRRRRRQRRRRLGGGVADDDQDHDDDGADGEGGNPEHSYLRALAGATLDARSSPAQAATRETRLCSRPQGQQKTGGEKQMGRLELPAT